jgi:hypothetical protein
MKCYGFSTRLPGMRPHWMIDTFTSLEDVMRWVDPWRERVWEERARRTTNGYWYRARRSRGRSEFPAGDDLKRYLFNTSAINVGTSAE